MSTTTYHGPGHARPQRIERPRTVWMVYVAEPGVPPMPVGFYDRERAVAWAAASEHRHFRFAPLTVRDAT